MTFKEMLEQMNGNEPNTNLDDATWSQEHKMSCGHTGYYHGYKKGDESWAFMICVKCNLAEEF